MKNVFKFFVIVFRSVVDTNSTIGYGNHWNKCLVKSREKILAWFLASINSIMKKKKNSRIHDSMLVRLKKKKGKINISKFWEKPK